MSEFGLRPELRLGDKTRIQTVFRAGKRQRSTELNIFYYPNQLLHPSLCISVAKKFVSKAFLRNRIKRIIRESFRLNQHRLCAYDFVIVVYKSMSLLNKKQMREKIDKHWQLLLSAGLLS